MSTSDWKQLSLGELCYKIGSGATPRGGKGAYKESGTPLVRSMNVYDFGFDKDGLAYIDDAQAERLKGSDIRLGDVLLNITGASVARCCIAPPSAYGGRVNQHVAVLRPKPELLDSNFLAYLLASSVEKPKLLSIAQAGATREALTKGGLEQYGICCPPLKVQKYISSTLCAYDDLIENNTRRIEILEEMAWRVYEEWFVHFRFPGHEEVSFKESELGRIPEGWEVAPLESFGTILTGKTPSKKKAELFGSDIPFIKLPDMHDQVFITETSEGLSKEGEDSQRKKTVPANSICVSCIGTGGIVVITSEPSQTNQQINTIVPTRSDMREFIYFSALSLRDDINNYGATGATMTNLSRGKFSSLRVISPLKEVVSSYSQLTAAMFDHILNLQEANRNLRAQRDLLLPKLVSGEIDVSDIPMPDDKEVEAA